MTEPNILAELDEAAQANLNADGQRRYADYKAQLLRDGTRPEDMGDILRGFIWNELEGDADDDDEG
jgi:hypothetical protein